MNTIKPDSTSKTCSKCSVNKYIKDFYKDKSHLDGLTSSCKSCYKEYKEQSKDITKKWNKDNYSENKEDIKLYSKEYYQNNKEAHNNRSKKWVEDNKDYWNDYLEGRKDITNARNRELYLINPERKIKNLMRSRLIELLKKNKTQKSKSAITLVGCSVTEVKQHLEKQFLPIWNWDNHGTVWEIDHIKPCSSFDLTDPEQQKECFHYTNLRPLFKTTKIAESFGYENYVGNRNKPKF